MKNPIPDFVDQVLRQWDFIAFFAYDNFELLGRGAVGLQNSKEGIQAMYGPRDYFVKQGDQRVLSMVDDYNPSREFLVHFDADGGTRTIRVRTPEGGRHPKRIWFFEILRRTSEAPEEIPEKLPTWFIQLWERLDNLRNNKAKSIDQPDGMQM